MIQTHYAGLGIQASTYSARANRASGAEGEIRDSVSGQQAEDPGLIPARTQTTARRGLGPTARVLALLVALVAVAGVSGCATMHAQGQQDPSLSYQAGKG
ncbi:MAG: hypothetical protein AB1758_01140, partial [Candidatus Eremiobacterota bacterium]